MAPTSAIDSEFYKQADTFFRENSSVALTYDDITLATLYSDILPRETHLETTLAEGLALHIPVLSADMDTVTESVNRSLDGLLEGAEATSRATAADK